MSYRRLFPLALLALFACDVEGPTSPPSNEGVPPTESMSELQAAAFAMLDPEAVGMQRVIVLDEGRTERFARVVISDPFSRQVVPFVRTGEGWMPVPDDQPEPVAGVAGSSRDFVCNSSRPSSEMLATLNQSWSNYTPGCDLYLDRPRASGVVVDWLSPSNGFYEAAYWDEFWQYGTYFGDTLITAVFTMWDGCIPNGVNGTSCKQVRTSDVNWVDTPWPSHDSVSSLYAHYTVNVQAPPGQVDVQISGPDSIYSTASRTWNAATTGGSGTPTYTWQRHDLGSNDVWTTVSSSSSYSTSVSSGYGFLLKVSVVKGGITDEDYYFVDVAIPLDVSISGTLTPYRATTATWTAVATGGRTEFTYVWEYRPTGGSWSTVDTDATYQRSLGNNAASFELLLIAQSGEFTDSTTVTVAPQDAPAVTVTIAGDTTPTRWETHSYSAVPSGGLGYGTYEFTWSERPQGSSTWTTVGTGQQYVRAMSATEDTFSLRVRVWSANATDAHVETIRPVDPEPLVVTLPTTTWANLTSVKSDQECTYEVTIEGGAAPFSVDWRTLGLGVPVTITPDTYGGMWATYNFEYSGTGYVNAVVTSADGQTESAVLNVNVSSSGVVCPAPR